MDTGGWIKLHRELLEKPIWQTSTSEQKVILITLLLMANHKTNEWEWQGKKYIVQPGQFITSLESIQKTCGKDVTIKKVRTALDRFEKYGFLANKSTNKNRLITIVNWELYQSEPKNGQADGQAEGKQRATNKNDNNEKKKEIDQITPDLQEVLSLYSKYCPKLPQVYKLNDKRKRTLKSWGDLQEIEAVFKIAGQSDFLCGVNDRNWIANFDWIIKPDNRLKILEGNYSKRQAADPEQRRKTRILNEE